MYILSKAYAGHAVYDVHAVYTVYKSMKDYVVWNVYAECTVYIKDIQLYVVSGTEKVKIKVSLQEKN